MISFEIRYHQEGPRLLPPTGARDRLALGVTAKENPCHGSDIGYVEFKSY